MTVLDLLKRPTAFLPVTMSVAALMTVAAHLVRYGVARETDEGTAAHIWQLLMLAQVPIGVLFALLWLPRLPRQALSVLALQAAAALAAAAPVYILNL